MPRRQDHRTEPTLLGCVSCTWRWAWTSTPVSLKSGTIRVEASSRCWPSFASTAVRHHPTLSWLACSTSSSAGNSDTTTALTAHALEWLSEHPDERARLSRQRDASPNPATEEFLRFFTPAPGDGRTVSDGMQFEGAALKEGERLWPSWAMANRDPNLFDDPDQAILDPKGNRHFSFGLGVHRCGGFQRCVDGVQGDAHQGARPAAGLSLRPRWRRALRQHRGHRGDASLAGDVHAGKSKGPQAWTKRGKSCSGSATSRDLPDPSPKQSGGTDHRLAGRQFRLGRVPLP